MAIGTDLLTFIDTLGWEERERYYRGMLLLFTSQTVIFGGDFNSHVQVQDSGSSEMDGKEHHWARGTDVQPLCTLGQKLNRKKILEEDLESKSQKQRGGKKCVCVCVCVLEEQGRLELTGDTYKKE